uniref:Uncharacterized protein n=1 Tax=Solanum lycopersicum TaxID=4081 RepID=A0A3Q7GY27_SOLLC
MFKSSGLLIFVPKFGFFIYTFISKDEEIVYALHVMITIKLSCGPIYSFSF